MSGITKFQGQAISKPDPNQLVVSDAVMEVIKASTVDETSAMTPEEQLIYMVLAHPAGFDIDFGGVLTARRYEYPEWAVEWQDAGRLNVLEFKSPMLAAKFFVKKRHDLRYGLDYEEKEALDRR
jgi:hypothetical protein